MESFLVRFQSSTPIIYQLYDGVGHLLFDVMTPFVHKSALMNGNRRKEAFDLSKVAANETKMQKSMHDINSGSQARVLIAKLEQEDPNHNLDAVKNEFRNCFMKVTEYLQNHLPVDSVFLRDLRVLNPDMQKQINGEAAFGRLATQMMSVLKHSSIYAVQPAEFVDKIKRQYILYRMETFPYDSDEPIDKYWSAVSTYVGTDGKCCFVELATLAKHCLCVSHGNADAERGFSVNKYVLQDRGSLKESTIVAIRLVKQSIDLHGGHVSRSIPVLHLFTYSPILHKFL